MKARIFLTLAALSLATTAVQAAVTLQFSQTGVARATGFANNAGVPTNGMAWGIIVDSSGNGFQSGNYDVFSSNGVLTVGGVQTDDYFITTGLLTGNQTATGTDPGGAGGITSLSNISYPSGVGLNDSFQIVWFETTPTDGSYYGTYGNAAFVLPADGTALTSYASAFEGAVADAAKPASHQFGAVPEPSRVLLLGLAMMGLVFRRRR